ncbi:MAG: hypothetical protein WCI72_03985 [archaeon]
MGKIIEARFEEIIPGEIGLIPSILEAVILNERAGEVLLPPPVRQSERVPGKKVNLDGRHRLLYRKMQGYDRVPVYLADLKYDSMSFKDFRKSPRDYVKENNGFIFRRWEEADKAAGKLTVSGYDHYFAQLVKKYPFLSSVDEFLDFTKSHPDITDNYFSAPNLKIKLMK